MAYPRSNRGFEIVTERARAKAIKARDQRPNREFEQLHPRAGKGTPTGGQFARKGGGLQTTPGSRHYSQARLEGADAASYQHILDNLPFALPPMAVRMVADNSPCATDYGLANACVVTSGDGATIYHAPGQPMSEDQFLHEIGHVVDHEVLNDADRSTLASLMGNSGPWVAHIDSNPGSPISHNASASEWFANAFAQIARARSLSPQYRGPRNEGNAHGFTNKQMAAIAEYVLGALGR